MAKPWERYQNEQPVGAPWEKFRGGETNLWEDIKQLGSEAAETLGEDVMGMVGAGETGLTMLTGAVAEPLAGAYGGVEAARLGSAERGLEAVEQARGASTYMPKTEKGQQMIGALGETVAPAAEYLGDMNKNFSDWVKEKTGSGSLATVAYTAPNVALEALGLLFLRGARTGTRLKDAQGNPTRELHDLLRKEGLTYEALEPQSQALIPPVADPKLIPIGETKPIRQDVVRSELEMGSRQEGLAGRRLEGEKVGVDPFGQEAIKQNWDKGFIQAVKTTTPETRRDMNRMLRAKERIMANKAVLGEMRPSDIAGEALVQRVKFIKGKADDARNDLNNIANTELRGAPMDAAPVMRYFEDALDGLGVKQVILEGQAKPKLDFSESVILEDKNAQRALNSMINLMGQGGVPDAYRFHQLKRQLDGLVEYRGGDPAKKTKTGENVIKGLRKRLNDQLRLVNEDYAKANDTLSSSLGAFNNLQSTVGKKLNINDTKEMGQELRKLFTNYKTRVAMERNVKELDDLAFELGGDFKNSAYDLSLFANQLDKRLGATAEGSMQGIMETAAERGAQAATQGLMATAGRMAIDKVSDAARKIRGVNDYNAIRSMEELLKRSGMQ
jgi:hypothetical protein